MSFLHWRSVYRYSLTYILIMTDVLSVSYNKLNKLMATNKKPKARKAPYVSSPLFKMTKEQHDYIKSSIRESFEKMKSGNFTQRQWIDLLTRMMVGKILITKHYTEDSVEQFKPCIQACVDIENRASLLNHEKWDMTKEEQETIEAGLDAVDEVQMETLRLEFLTAHREADKQITKMFIHNRKGIEKGLVA